MVEVKATTNENGQAVCNSLGLEYIEGETTVLLATEKDKQIGSCVYDVKGDVMTLRDITPADDYVMADSLLRSALFVAANKGIFNVCWAEKVSADLVLKLGFVKNITNCSIDVTNLFSSCENCKKEK